MTKVLRFLEKAIQLQVSLTPNTELKIIFHRLHLPGCINWS